MEFKHAGMDCLVIDGPTYCGGAVNGYVRVCEPHPLFGKKYTDRINFLARYLERTKSKSADSVSPVLLLCATEERMATPEYVLDAPGGITFSGVLRNREGWWFGFDTGHYNDVPHTQNYEFVGKAVRKLAEQLSEMKE